MPQTKSEITGANHSPPVKNKYIVPPGLQTHFFDFLNLTKVGENEPIMIVGDTGVGKSMFLHVFGALFDHEHGGDTKKHPICWVNCAHFQPNLARAELFGHVQGAFTGAIKNADGCVKLANNGLLILEEVGELPLEVQAMLLTFIETGQYKRVGDPVEKHANVRIIAATNRESALRDDFRYRFLPFYLPSLFERRGDVLYYLFHKFPDFISTLTHSEVLALLAYHWPGNVREINRVGFLMQMHKVDVDELQFDSDHSKATFQLSRLEHLDERYTFLDSSLAMDALDKVSTWDGDIKLLERLLNKNRVGLSDESLKPAFVGLDLMSILNGEPVENHDDEERKIRETEHKLGLKLFPELNEFDEAWNGYLAFCGLFGQNPFKNANILSSLDNADVKYFDISRVDYSPSKEKDVIKLQKAIMRSIMGLSVIGYRYPDDPYEYWNVLEEQKEQYETDNGMAAGNIDQDLDIWSLKEDDLRKKYYEGLLKKTGGNVRMASQLAGVVETTFRARMDKLEVQYKKTK